jgi:2-acylglycerol O-acyltransferase 2
MPAPSGTVSASEGVAGETHVEGNAEGERQRSPIQAILSGISVWDVPLERRKQTAAVALFVSSLIFIPGCFVTSLLLLFHPLSRIPVIIYLLYITLLDSSTITGARKSDFFRRLPMFKHYANYFPVKLHKTADLDPDHRYVIGYHPHGIIGIGAIASFASEGPGISQLLPGLDIYLLTLAINFRVPLLREIWLLMGLCDSSKRTFRTILSRGSGSAVVVVVGGAAEALQAAPGTMDLILEQRRGFVRQALLNDALLVPAIGALLDSVRRARARAALLTW